jgi:enoyl-CoA hydratase/carnithine racemase
MPHTTVVIAERRGPVLILVLNRPERRNAWNRAMQQAYFDALEGAENDPSVRAIVLTGAGATFCVGADLEALARIGAGDPRAVRLSERPTSMPLGIRKPLIAAINGSCAGIGLIQALYCDVRFVARDARLTTAYARRGLIGEHGIAWLLPRIVGRANALDLLLSGRVIDGEEAVALALANWVCEPDDLLERAVAYASQLAEQCSPAAMAVIKAQLRDEAEADVTAALERSRELMLESYQRPDLREGVLSFRERRPPRFPPLPPRDAPSGGHADR